MKDYSFGNHICALRVGRGLSQFQLGTLVGVTDKAVSKWENGDARPRVSTCYRLAEVLGVSISELLSCEQRVTTSARKELDRMNKELWKKAYERLWDIYGDRPPMLCWSRLASEEAALNGTDAIQSIAVLGRIEEEAKKRNRTTIATGAVNSSFVAWLLGATKVDPLPPHYRCPKCKKTEFVSEVRDGFDLRPKRCSCGAMFDRDGHDIPFEGYAKLVCGQPGAEVRVPDGFRSAAVKVLSDFYEGTAEVLPVKVEERETGWSSERYVVLPLGKEKPQVASDGFWHTDFDTYWDWHGDEPVYHFPSNKQLDEIEAADRPLPDVSKLIGADMAEQVFRVRKETAASIAEAVEPDEPHDFDLLIRIDGLSHATGAWEGNGKQLVQSKQAAFRMLPAVCEDVWDAVVKGVRGKGVYDHGLALQVMENARRGKYSDHGMPENVEALLHTLGLPDWYPDHLRKIRYLFPKGHCVAYLIAEMIHRWVCADGSV